MASSRLWAGVLLVTAAMGAAQTADNENFEPPGVHPSLLLNARRLRLLRRERERNSPRWEQFHALVAGKANLPEPGFALALYYQVSGDEDAGRRAVEWALGGATDVRQIALVFDWCQPLLNGTESASLAAPLERALANTALPASVAEARSRVFAAAALADSKPELAANALRAVIVSWWRGRVAPALDGGRDVIPRSELYAAFEMMHAVSDNLSIDLRTSAPRYFRELAAWDLLSYYPASYPAAENEFRIPAVKGGQPDLRLAVMARAADLAMVAYDSNSRENQFIQGWLIHDRFVMRGALAAPYEFLWANPYLPGLSYYSAPLAAHDGVAGRIFVRASWDDDATWAGYFDGELQVFEKGAARVVGQQSSPLRFGDTVIQRLPVPSWPEFAEPVQQLFFVGLKPSHTYLLEIDDREMQEERTDRGGILGLTFPEGFQGAIRIREAPARQ